MAFAGTGVVVLWDDRGYGFIRDDTNHERDLFVHAKDISSGAARKVNTRVTYRVIHSPKGAQAVEVAQQSEVQRSDDGECDVLTEAEFRAELAGYASQMVSVDAFLAAARKHGWVDG